jgi:hypothetical protein
MLHPHFALQDRVLRARILYSTAYLSGGKRGRILIIKYLFLQAFDPTFELPVLLHLRGYGLVAKRRAARLPGSDTRRANVPDPSITNI